MIGTVVAVVFWIVLSLVLAWGYVSQRRADAEVRAYDRQLAAREALRRIDRRDR